MVGLALVVGVLDFQTEGTEEVSPLKDPLDGSQFHSVDGLGLGVVVRLEVERHVCQDDSTGIDDERGDLVPDCFVQNRLLDGLEPTGIELSPALHGIDDRANHSVLLDRRQS